MILTLNEKRFDTDHPESVFVLGDCMDYLPLFPDGYFDLAVVDPVYGDVTAGGYTTGKYSGKRMSKGAAADLKDYHSSIWQQEKTGAEYFKELFRVSKNQVIWGGNYFAAEIGRDSQCWLVWDKCHPEGIKYAECELAYTSFNQRTRIFRYMWNGMIQQNMAEKEERIHPTQKPVALYHWVLNLFADDRSIVLDTHVGSASSLVACHDKNITYVGFEKDETYYKTAAERLERAESQINIFDIMRENQCRLS